MADRGIRRLALIESATAVIEDAPGPVLIMSRALSALCGLKRRMWGQPDKHIPGFPATTGTATPLRVTPPEAAAYNGKLSSRQSVEIALDGLDLAFAVQPGLGNHHLALRAPQKMPVQIRVQSH